MVLTHKKSSKIKGFKGAYITELYHAIYQGEQNTKIVIARISAILVNFPVRLFRRLNGAFSQNMQIYFLLVFAQLSGS